jgi:hypothetical protein
MFKSIDRKKERRAPVTTKRTIIPHLGHFEENIEKE